jgi:regulator of cell morphogenesis and NO signaling
MISSSMKVRDVAINSPHATRVFEKLKIDYCCGGDRQLGEACATAGVDLEALEQMLAETGTLVNDSKPDFQRLSAAELIKYILDTHHVFTKTEMARLEPLTAKVVLGPRREPFRVACRQNTAAATLRRPDAPHVQRGTGSVSFHRQT